MKLRDRRRLALEAGREDRVPVARAEALAADRAGEGERRRVRIGCRRRGLHVEQVFAQRLVVAARRDVDGGWVGRRRIGVPEERRPRVAPVAGPPADGDRLRVARVASDEVLRGWLNGVAREQVDREVERSPPGVYRRGAASPRRAKLLEDERSARGGAEV